MGSQAVSLPGTGFPCEGLALSVVDGRVFVTAGPLLVSAFDEGDLALRNLAIVSLREAGVTGRDVAHLFGLTDRQVSSIWTRARREGSSGLVRRDGPRPKLSDADRLKARRLRASGVPGSEIAKRFGVSDATISRATAGVAVSSRLLEDGDDHVDPDAGGSDLGVEGSDLGAELVSDVAPDGHTDADAYGGGGGGGGVGEVWTRYAGAALLYGFLSRVGVESVLGAGGKGGRGVRYRSWDVVLAVLFGLVLGEGSVEAVKHLGRGDLGALWGVGLAPELKTLRSRLGRLADGCDPLGLQQMLTRRLLEDDCDGLSVLYVDDHFVPYYGARPVAKGWNTKRGRAMPGWDDSFVCDPGGRVLAFTTSEPSGLSQTMRPVLAQLRAAAGADPAMVAFDRGGSYPAVFTWLSTQGIDWLTWRRGDVVDPGAGVAGPLPVCHVDSSGTAHNYLVTEETIELKDYEGPVRQISLYDDVDGEPVVQILTSNKTDSAAVIVWLLRRRWQIENTLKYLVHHHGIDQICDYRMNLVPDTREVRNPERKAVNDKLKQLRAKRAEVERVIGETFADPAPAETGRYRNLKDERYMITDEIQELKTRLKSIPAKIPANQAKPGAKLAQPRTERRCYQMILRVLAYNADLWTARQLDTYLNNPDEVRAITRNLLKQPGTITYTPDRITVAINTPDRPATAHALTKLCDQLNHTTTPTRIPGDPRPITYTTTTTHRTPHQREPPEV